MSGEAGEYAYTYLHGVPLDAPTLRATTSPIQRHGDLAIVIPAESVELLRGATLDRQGGSVMRRPRDPQPPAAGPAIGVRRAADLCGDVAQRVIQVLERADQPRHRRARRQRELVAVEEDIAYLRLGGGCQGCGMAAVTLSQGIEVAILDAVPEITG